MVYGVTIGDCPGYIMETGNTHQLSANVAPSDASDTTVSWSTSNSSVATVDPGGLVTAVSAGTATISITTNDGGFTANCKVGVISTGLHVGEVESQFVDVYPNPTSRILNFKFFESVSEKTIRIYNLKGQLLITRRTFNSSLVIDIQKFIQEGMLIVNVISEKQSTSFKVNLD